MAVEFTTNTEYESPTCYTLSEGSVCVPKQEKEDAMVDYSYNPYSPAKYSTAMQKRKRAPKKERAEKKPKAKKIKQEPKGTSQRTLDEWLKKRTLLNGILEKQSSSSSRNVSFLFKKEVRNLFKNGNLSKKTTFLGFNSGGRLCETKDTFCTETKRTKEGAKTKTFFETTTTEIPD